MAKVSLKKLRELLTKQLKLRDPAFELERLSNGKVAGCVISDSFKQMKDDMRQKRIWDVLEAEYQGQATQVVGLLLAYTDAEWNVKLEEC